MRRTVSPARHPAGKAAQGVWLLAVLCGILILPACGNRAEEEPGRPNIILIVADDLGYGDLTCYNPSGKVPTPHIDRMAAEGKRFTRFYAGSTVCAPSRCALMTGYHMGHAYLRGNSREPLRLRDTTLAQRLQLDGYKTGMFGKWGLGEVGSTGEPQLKGFDEFFGYINQRHAHHYFTDHLFEIRSNRLEEVPVDTNRYTQALIMERALSFIRSHRQEPFFLYLPLTIPHAELQVPDSLMQPFLNKDGSSKLGPETPFKQGKTTYRTQLQPHAAFAAMITRLDKDVGSMLDLLKELNLDENTCVFFTSDNGPHAEGGGDPEFFNSGGPLRGIKRDLYEGGIRVPMIARAPGRIPAGETGAIPWAFWDLLPTVCSLTGTRYDPEIDGISFSGILSSENQEEKHDYLYWQFNEGVLKEALIRDNWKLLRFKQQGAPEVLELYNLARDEGEENNLVSAHPETARELRRLMDSAKTPSEHPLFDWSDIEK